MSQEIKRPKELSFIQAHKLLDADQKKGLLEALEITSKTTIYNWFQNPDRIKSYQKRTIVEYFNKLGFVNVIKFND